MGIKVTALYHRDSGGIHGRAEFPPGHYVQQRFFPPLYYQPYFPSVFGSGFWKYWLYGLPVSEKDEFGSGGVGAWEYEMRPPLH